jgi:probable HAF family extracellular repeat protein
VDALRLTALPQPRGDTTHQTEMEEHMQRSMGTTPARFWGRSLHAALLAAAVLSGGGTTIAAAPLEPVADTIAAHGKTTYRIIPLSDDISAYGVDINAKGQVAFVETVNGAPRALFYDGKRVREIGTLGGSRAIIGGLNDHGQISGTSTVSPADDIWHAFRWSKATGMRDLTGPGIGTSFATAINNKGQVVGSAEFNPASGNAPHAFRWSPGAGMVDLAPHHVYSLAHAINEAGVVAGGFEPPNGSLVRIPFRWTQADGFMALVSGNLGLQGTRAFDINEAGHIVGSVLLNPLQEEHAFLWTPQHGLSDLGTGNASSSVATRINDMGMVIGYVRTPFIYWRAFIWTRQTGLVEIPATNPDSSFANDLNKRGQVVGRIGERAFVWTRGEGVVDLNTRIPDAPPGLELINATAISDDGAIVANTNTGLVLLVPHPCAQVAPVIGPVNVTGMPRANTLLSFSASFKDVDLRDTHRATWSWGDGGAESGMVSERPGTGSVSGQHVYRSRGIYTVRIIVTDSSGKHAAVQRKVVVGE